MMSRSIYICLYLLIIFSAMDAGAYKSEWSLIASGGGSGAAGGSYKSELGIIGQPMVGKSTETSTYGSLFAGFISAFVQAEATVITFYDQSPSETAENTSYPLTCKVTVESFSNDLATSTVKVRISNSGTSPSSFSSWFSGAVPETVYSSKKIRYSISIPTSALSSVSFKAGDSNYIQWRIKDTANNEQNSAMYRVKLQQSSVSILQPVDYSSIYPVLEAEFSGAIQSDTLNITISDALGNTIINETGSTGYDSSAMKFTKACKSPGFEPGKKYTFTISVKDIGGTTISDNSEFIVNNGMIADLIPFPSPVSDIHTSGVTIRYVLKEDSFVSIYIYNTSGEVVYELIDSESRDAGLHDEDKWFGNNYASKHVANGIYFCEVIALSGGKEYRHYTSLAVLKR